MQCAANCSPYFFFLNFSVFSAPSLYLEDFVVTWVMVIIVFYYQTSLSEKERQLAAWRGGGGVGASIQQIFYIF
jgi:hypothetical protein